MIENTKANEGEFALALAGNKCDMPRDQHKISSQMSEQVAKKYDMIF